MSKHSIAPSPPPTTYTGKAPVQGATLICTRCGRSHPYPKAGGPAIRCECGWRYENRDGHVVEEFVSRLGT